jgi:hypothetical protein
MNSASVGSMYSAPPFPHGVLHRPLLLRSASLTMQVLCAAATAACVLAMCTTYYTLQYLTDQHIWWYYISSHW